MSHHRLGIRGSYFCGQECFKADCVSPCVSSILLTSAKISAQGFVILVHLLFILTQAQKTHKLVHDLAKGTVTQKFPDGTFNPWATHKYCGPLRPRYPLSPKRDVPAHIARPDYADDSNGALTRAKIYARELLGQVPVG